MPAMPMPFNPSLMFGLPGFQGQQFAPQMMPPMQMQMPLFMPPGQSPMFLAPAPVAQPTPATVLPQPARKSAVPVLAAVVDANADIGSPAKRIKLEPGTEAAKAESKDTTNGVGASGNGNGKMNGTHGHASSPTSASNTGTNGVSPKLNGKSAAPAFVPSPPATPLPSVALPMAMLSSPPAAPASAQSPAAAAQPSPSQAQTQIVLASPAMPFMPSVKLEFPPAGDGLSVKPEAQRIAQPNGLPMGMGPLGQFPIFVATAVPSPHAQALSPPAAISPSNAQPPSPPSATQSALASIEQAQPSSLSQQTLNELSSLNPLTLAAALATVLAAANGNSKLLAQAVASAVGAAGGEEKRERLPGAAVCSLSVSASVSGFVCHSGLFLIILCRAVQPGHRRVKIEDEDYTGGCGTALCFCAVSVLSVLV